jgi:hypothetical protein
MRRLLERFIKNQTVDEAATKIRNPLDTVIAFCIRTERWKEKYK